MAGYVKKSVATIGAIRQVIEKYYKIDISQRPDLAKKIVDFVTELEKEIN